MLFPAIYSYVQALGNEYTYKYTNCTCQLILHELIHFTYLNAFDPLSAMREVQWLVLLYIGSECPTTMPSS